VPEATDRDASLAPPVIAIVGRPNVGKSTLLNTLAQTRVSIVEPSPGVTRDRVGVLCTLADRTVELMDTGGIGIVDHQGLSEHVEQQIRRAIESATLVLFLVDAKDGVTPLDTRVADRLRRIKDRVLFVANKVESRKTGWNLGELEGLGYGEPIAISAKERINLAELEEAIAARLPEGPRTPVRMPAPDLKLAVVGRVNAGKSSIVNALLGDDRMIVSEVPGTTRAAVDLRLEEEGEAIVLIDTAGIRKERTVSGSLEFYAQRRAERAMRRADVTALVVDASVAVGSLDRRIAGYALEQFHPLIVVANKWDLRPHGMRTGVFVEYLQKTLGAFRFAPIVFMSAKQGKNVHGLIDVAWNLHEQSGHRVSTADVNRALTEAQALRAPRPAHGRVGTVYYGTQVDVRPPTFLLFVNDPDLFDPNWLRYLENRFRETLPFPEVPLRFHMRARVRGAGRRIPPEEVEAAAATIERAPEEGAGEPEDLGESPE
jgi:GTP-binding protein